MKLKWHWYAFRKWMDKLLRPNQVLTGSRAVWKLNGKVVGSQEHDIKKGKQ